SISPARAARSYQSAARAASGAKPALGCGFTGSKKEPTSTWAIGLPSSAALRQTRNAPAISPDRAYSLPLTSIASCVGLVARNSPTVTRIDFLGGSTVGAGTGSGAGVAAGGGDTGSGAAATCGSGCLGK